MTLAPAQTGSVQTIVSLDGISVNQSVQPAGNTVCKPSGALPAAFSGSLTTRSSGTAGVITFPSAVALQGTETIALFWSGYIYDIPPADWSITGGTAGAATAITITAIPANPNSARPPTPPCPRSIRRYWSPPPRM